MWSRRETRWATSRRTPWRGSRFAQARYKAWDRLAQICGQFRSKGQPIGAFVRALLPIQLTGGFSLTSGHGSRSIPVTCEECGNSGTRMPTPELGLDGYLANDLPPWERKVLGVPAVAEVLDPTQERLKLLLAYRHQRQRLTAVLGAWPGIVRIASAL